MSKVAKGKVVSIHYTLTDDSGAVIDSSDGADPLEYLHGGENIVPGLERQLTGKTVGDKLRADVPAKEGYGERKSGKSQSVPRASFPPEVDLQVGMQFAAEAGNGHMVPIWISDIKGDQVFIDRNHPLAGKNLHFDVEVVKIRDATKQEIEHGHPHGPHGHDH
jgi:FKBP-type peptidyl-prolyl cis-trans isomerase SlyD